MELKDVMSVIAGFSGAWLGARLTLSRYKKEKNWDYKVQTYRKILSLFEEIAFWGLSEHTSYYAEGVPGGGEVEKRVFSKSMRELTQIRYSAALYLSQTFLDLLSNALDDFSERYEKYAHDERYMDNDENYYSAMAGDISNKAYEWLGSLSEQAKKDLSIEV
ncbi:MULTISPECIES: hypothetical protein [Pectobacterium]|uniref:hypothetical protein n=1 Tax=Pectobacterium TaxID=122277 RepID=UPI002A80DD25|nr:hypothetical protein [Pectobacterium brasiliense]MDY4350750.1 hypothetical protein [Pectobacterium brasiliense]